MTTASGEQKRAYAFTTELPNNAPIGAPVGGYKFRLVDFEKVADAHILSIQRDPGANVFYLGSALLTLTLCAVFFFSHQRVSAVIEERSGTNYEVVLGANSNRNLMSLEDRFKQLTNAISGQSSEVKES